VKLTTHLQLISRLRISDCIPPLPIALCDVHREVKGPNYVELLSLGFGKVGKKIMKNARSNKNYS
jgi:hypothetical protein